MLDLIESAGSWNSFDGEKIAALLRENRNLWRAAILTDAGGDFRVNSEGIITGIDPDLKALGSLLHDFLAYDVIRAIPQAGRDRELEALFDSMHADSVRWLKLEDARSALGHITREEFAAGGYHADHAILEAWWD